MNKETKVEWLNKTFNENDDWRAIAYILAGEIDDINNQLKKGTEKLIGKT